MTVQVSWDCVVLLYWIIMSIKVVDIREITPRCELHGVGADGTRALRRVHTARWIHGLMMVGMRIMGMMMMMIHVDRLPTTLAIVLKVSIQLAAGTGRNNSCYAALLAPPQVKLCSLLARGGEGSTVWRGWLAVGVA